MRSHPLKPLLRRVMDAQSGRVQASMTTTTPNSDPNYTDDELHDLAEIMNILSSARRVRTLTALRGESELRRSELVQRVIDQTFANERVTAQKRKRINISLYQVHLSTLSEVGALEWSRDSDIIRPGPKYDDIMSVFDWALLAHRRS